MTSEEVVYDHYETEALEETFPESTILELYTEGLRRYLRSVSSLMIGPVKNPSSLTIVYDRMRATGKKSHAISFLLAGQARSIGAGASYWPAGV